MLKQVVRVLGILETSAARSAMAITVGCVIWGVLTRYVTAKPAVWTSELSGIAFTWTVFVGAMIAFRGGAHISVPLVVDALPAPMARAVRQVSDLLSTLFLGTCAYLSILMMIEGASRISPVLKIPFSLVYLAPAFAFAAMTAQSVLLLFKLVEPEVVESLDGESL